jgi:hypothetical protein
MMPAMASLAAKSESELQAQLQATLNVLPAYTWYADPSGALTFVNKRHAGWFLTFGILLTVLGVVCVRKAQTATTFSILALGAQDKIGSQVTEDARVTCNKRAATVATRQSRYSVAQTTGIPVAAEFGNFVQSDPGKRR